MNHNANRLAVIASYPKSGNTWVRMMLKNYYLNRPAEETLNTPAIGLLEGARAFKRITGLEPSMENVAANWGLYTDGKMADENYIHKTHMPHGRIGQSSTVPPSTRVVHLVRNPVSVAPSFAHHMGQTLPEAVASMVNPNFALNNFPNEVGEEFDAMPWAMPIGSWKTHTVSWLSSPNPRLTIRYEDIVRNPRYALGLILKFLDIPIVSERVNFAVEEASFEKLRAAEKKVGFRESSKHAENNFFRSGGKKKDALPVKLQQRIRGEFSDILPKFQYDK